MARKGCEVKRKPAIPLAALEAMRGAASSGWPDQACIDLGAQALIMAGHDDAEAHDIAARVWRERFTVTNPN